MDLLKNKKIRLFHDTHDSVELINLIHTMNLFLISQLRVSIRISIQQWLSFHKLIYIKKGIVTESTG